jgi:hypothetical protein
VEVSGTVSPGCNGTVAWSGWGDENR